MPDRRSARRSVTDRVGEYLLRQTAAGRRISALAAELGRRRVPNHVSSMFGVATLACVAVIMVTGLFLMFFYTPSGAPVSYGGGYLPLDGANVSKAFQSTLRISFEVNAGLLMRQAHHWAALLLPATIILQMLTTFFTGGFRRPRQFSWVLLFLIFIVALVGGWSGYALPDDMLSGTGLRIVEGIVLGIPLVGSWLSALVFGGEFPGEIIEHLYPIHVLIVPAALLGLIALRIWVSYANKPAQFAGEGRTENTVAGIPLLPNAAARAGGLFLMVMGLLFFLAAAVTISPIWLYGPSAAGDASAGSQPDWYTGFLDGALRLVPPGWEFVWLGRTWTLAVLVPLGVVTVFMLVVLLYPFVEAWITGDHRDHHLLDRPRNTPTRTGIGVAGMTFYGALWGAGSADILATHFSVGLESVIAFYRVLVLLGPIVAFTITRRVCLALQQKDRQILLHGFETGRVVRLPGGEYIEIHRQLDAHQRWRLVNTSDYAPLQLRPDESGHIRWSKRLQVRASQFFFEDRLTPLTASELEGTHSDNDVERASIDERQGAAPPPRTSSRNQEV